MRCRRAVQQCQHHGDCHAVIAAQRRFGLPETGIVNFDTWDEIYDQFSGIETTSWHDPENFPYTATIINGTPPRNRYAQSTTLTSMFYGETTEKHAPKPKKNKKIKAETVNN